VLLYDILSYLTFEGVNLCEQLELAMQQQGSDLKPYLRRLHLVSYNSTQDVMHFIGAVLVM
jgi:timeless protein